MENKTDRCASCDRPFEEGKGISGYDAEFKRLSYDFACALRLGISVDEEGFLA